MKTFINKYWIYVASVLLILIYVVTRIYNLTSLPIFTDEAIYIRWSQIARDDAVWRFISLTDGKQPMFIWIAMGLIHFFQDPLFAGRLVSVIAGFFSLIGIVLVGREVFKNTVVGFLAGLIYVLYPFSLVYDRLALYDSLVAMFMLWSLYFSVLLARHVRLDLGLILGMVIGGGMLTKTSANFAFILLPFSLLLFPFKKKLDRSKIGQWVLFALAAFIVANIMYNILRLSPYFHIIADKNLTFIYSFSDWIKDPFAHVFGNLRGLSGWLLDYTAIPFLVLIAASFVVSKKFFKEKLLLLIWFIVPFLALAFFGKVIYPRFILFMTMPLLLLGSYALYCLLVPLKNVLLKILIVLVFTSMFIISDYYIITDMYKAPIPSADKEQFVTGWPAGGGVTQTIDFLNKESASKNIYVGTQGTFGLMPYSLEMYLYKNPNVKIKGFWPIEDKPPQELIDASRSMPTYVVFYQPCPSCVSTGLAPVSWPVEKVLQIKKPGMGEFYTLYKVTPQIK